MLTTFDLLLRFASSAKDHNSQMHLCSANSWRFVVPGKGNFYSFHRSFFATPSPVILVKKRKYTGYFLWQLLTTYLNACNSKVHEEPTTVIFSFSSRAFCSFTSFPCYSSCITSTAVRSGHWSRGSLFYTNLNVSLVPPEKTTKQW